MAHVFQKIRLIHDALRLRVHECVQVLMQVIVLRPGPPVQMPVLIHGLHPFAQSFSNGVDIRSSCHPNALKASKLAILPATPGSESHDSENISQRRTQA